MHPGDNIELIPSSDLHLDVSVRSPRSKLLGEWVNGLLDNQPLLNVATANSDFPIAFTRDLETARAWLYRRADAKERAGLLARSGALRLAGSSIGSFKRIPQGLFLFGLVSKGCPRYAYPQVAWRLRPLNSNVRDWKLTGRVCAGETTSSSTQVQANGSAAFSVDQG